MKGGKQKVKEKKCESDISTVSEEEECSESTQLSCRQGERDGTGLKSDCENH